MSLEETPSQTAGPFLHIGLLPEALPPLTSTVEPEISLHGTVTDGAGEPVRDALVELWDASTGQWLRCATDGETGSYRFALRQPAAAFVSLYLLARGIDAGLHTRAYLAPAPGDALLAALGERAATLTAQPDGAAQWRFDIRLQGENETVFLEP